MDFHVTSFANMYTSDYKLHTADFINSTGSWKGLFNYLVLNSGLVKGGLNKL